MNSTFAVRSPNEYSISLCSTIFVYCTREVEAHAAVPGFHAAAELTTYTEITCRSRQCQSAEAAFHLMMFRGRVGTPDFVNGCPYIGQRRLSLLALRWLA